MVPVSCVIPARMASSRFPGKMLHPLLGTPLLIHTLRRAVEADCFDEVVCFTDARVIRDEVEAAGFRACLTGPAANGTDRIGKYADLIKNDLIINLQGDEPAFPPEALRILAQALIQDPAEVHILVEDHIARRHDLINVNRCKAGLDENGHVMDFYRLAPRMAFSESRLQFGAYGYHKNYVRRYAEIVPSEREYAGNHELLRDLDLAPVKAHPCAFAGHPVDVPADAAIAEALLVRYPVDSALPAAR